MVGRLMGKMAVSPADNDDNEGADLRETEHARPRKRTWRACDKCSASRTRCDGQRPCRRCEDYGYSCNYERPVKKRGRTRVSKTTTYGPGSPELEIQELDSQSLPSPTARARPSVTASAGDLASDTAQNAVAETQRLGQLSVSTTTEAFSPGLSQTQSHQSRQSHQPQSLGSQTDRLPPLAYHLSTVQCRYRCLYPLLPYLGDILQVSMACDLFDVYLIDPGTSLFRCAAPYILTRVFRTKSLLHPTHPRPITPALLATILWCCAQTAELPLLLLPGARAQVTKSLYELALSLISERGDQERWPALSASASFLHGEEPSPGTSWTGEGRELLQGLDDVLTHIIFCIAISGGDFKADCLQFWDKALRQATFLGLNLEDEPCQLPGPSCPKLLCDCRFQQGNPPLAIVEAKEERRRVFWLLYSLDRHLSLSYNTMLRVPDSSCQVYAPLPETVWEHLDEIPGDSYRSRRLGPPANISGTSFFEYFLPLMMILGDIIVVHHGRLHPRIGSLQDQQVVNVIAGMIASCETSVAELAAEAETADFKSRNPQMGNLRLVLAYSTHILHVLHVLLHGKWDAIGMLDNDDDWISTADFSKCASHAIAASGAVSQILEFDPELTFMPYLFGIYLLQGSFILLLFADRMPQLGTNQSVEQACETLIRAHEVCIVTLSTEFQRSFRRVLRSTMYSVRGISLAEWEEHKLARRKILSLYRWTSGARGLGI